MHPLGGSDISLVLADNASSQFANNWENLRSRQVGIFDSDQVTSRGDKNDFEGVGILGGTNDADTGGVDGSGGCG